MLPFEVETVVVCDDIRQEKNGKWLLIGVYGSDILVPAFPADFRLAIWILADPKEVGPSQVKLRIVGPHDSTMVEGELEYDIRQMSPTILAMAGLPVQVQSEGLIKVEMLAKKATEWVTIKTISLKRQTPGVT